MKSILFAFYTVFFALSVTGAVAQEIALPPYDGTGSRLDVWPDSKPFDPLVYKVASEKQDQIAASLRSKADSGDLNATVQLGAMLEQGDISAGVDLTGAFDLYERAAAKGSTYGRQRICVAYLLGEGRPKDIEKGLDICGLLGRADGAGLFSAAFDFDNGISGPRDENVATGLYLKAAKAGSGDAMDALGRKILAGGNPERAREWFVKGCYLGSADAMDDLARLSESGSGGEKDLDEAYWLYANAARRGNEHAKAWLNSAPPTARPLRRTIVSSANFGLSKVVADGEGHEKRTPFNFQSLLQTAYPAIASEDKKGGQAYIHCYINTRHKLDVCLIEKENPVGYYFGWVLSAVYEANIVAPERDAIGKSTAHAVFTLGVNWVPE